MRVRPLRTLLAACACGIAGFTGIAHAERVSDTQPAWATRANRTAAVAGSERMVFSVWLGWRNPADLDRTLADLTDPASANHGRWLTPGEFHARYSPSPAQVEAVRTWLTTAGFAIVDVPQNRLFVTASGTVADVERTFDVTENLYRVAGTDVRAPDADPAVPATIASDVQAITGLDGSLATH